MKSVKQIMAKQQQALFIFVVEEQTCMLSVKVRKLHNSIKLASKSKTHACHSDSGGKNLKHDWYLCLSWWWNLRACWRCGISSDTVACFSKSRTILHASVERFNGVDVRCANTSLLRIKLRGEFVSIARKETRTPNFFIRTAWATRIWIINTLVSSNDVYFAAISKNTFFSWATSWGKRSRNGRNKDATDSKTEIGFHRACGSVLWLMIVHEFSFKRAICRIPRLWRVVAA